MASAKLLNAIATVGQIVGAVVSIFNPAVGISIMVGAASLQVAAALSMRPPRPSALSSSATYGFASSQNPTDPSTRIPGVYGRHRIRPILLQESVSPHAHDSTKGTGAGYKDQSLSMLFAVAEGPVAEITDIRINGTAVLSDEELEAVGTGNGSNKKFRLHRPFAYLPSLTVQVDGTEVYQAVSTYDQQNLAFEVRTQTVGDKSVEDYGITIRLDKKGAKIRPQTVALYVNGTAQDRRGSTYPWSAFLVTKRKIRISFRSARPPANANIRVSFEYLAEGDLLVSQNKRGDTLLRFGTAPAATKKVTANYRRQYYPGVEIQTRLGDPEQEPLDGFAEDRNSFPPDNGPQPLDRNTAKTYTSAKPVDDLRIGIHAPQGFVAYGDDGSFDQVNARVVIKYTTVEGGAAQEWRILYRLGQGDDLDPDWRLYGTSASPKSWEIGIRDTLRRLLDAGWNQIPGYNRDTDEELEYLRNKTIRVSVERKDVVRNENESTVFDRVVLQYVTEVVDQRFTFPGTALLALKAIAGENLSGAPPQVECIVTRGDIYDPRTGGVADSSNPALAVFDLITSGRGTLARRMGGGAFFTESDIDLDTLEAWADWCDELVTKDDGGTEKRHTCNIVLDSPQSLSETVADIAANARCFAVQQGCRWRFPIDRDGDAVAAFTDSVDPVAECNIVEGSLEIEQDPYLDTPTDLEVEFWNQDNDWTPDVAYATVEPESNETRKPPRRISALGVTRRTEAERLAAHLLASAREYPGLAGWLATPGSVLVEAGDIVTISSTVPGGTAASGWGSVKARILAVARASGAEGDDGAPTPATVRYLARTYTRGAYAQATDSIETGRGDGVFGKPPSGTSRPGGSGSSSQEPKKVRKGAVKSLSARRVA